MRATRYSTTFESTLPQHSSPRLFIERRTDQRVRIQGGLASYFSLPGFQPCEGDAVLFNVSLTGCEIESEQSLPKEQPYQLIIYVPPHPSPLLIQTAITRWSTGSLHGIGFLDLSASCRLKLNEVVRHGPASSWVVSSIRFGMWSNQPFP